MAPETMHFPAAGDVDLESGQVELSAVGANFGKASADLDFLRLDITPCPKSSFHLQVLAAVTGESILELPHHQVCELLISDVQALVAESQAIPVSCVSVVHNGAVVSSEASLQGLWLPGTNLTIQIAMVLEETPKQQTLESTQVPRKKTRRERCEERCNCCGDVTCFNSCCPSVICCILLPFGISLGLFVGNIFPTTLAFSIFWGASCLTCCCWPVFAMYHTEELQGDYDEGGLEGCYVSIGGVWCCILIFVLTSLVVCFTVPQ